MGTLEELDKALEKVNAQAARISMRPQRNKTGNDGKKRKNEKNEETEVKKRKREAVQEQGLAMGSGLTNGIVESSVKSQAKEEVIFKKSFLLKFSGQETLFVLIG